MPSSTGEPGTVARFLAHPIVTQFLLLEWIVTGLWYGTFQIVGHLLITPHCRTFSWSDPTISYSFDHHEEFPNYTLIFIGTLPMLVYIGFGRYLHNMSWREVNLWCLIQVQSIAIMVTMVEPSKLYAGRLRPDFLDRLRLSGYSESSFADPFAYCTAEDPKGLLHTGRMSFPSGHSSLSFCAMVPLMMFLIMSLRVFHHASLIRFMGAFSPMILAFTVAISRTRDHRHHFSDILGGGIMGFVSALLALALRLQFVCVGMRGHNGNVVAVSMLAWRRSVATRHLNFIHERGGEITVMSGGDGDDDQDLSANDPQLCCGGSRSLQQQQQQQQQQSEAGQLMMSNDQSGRSSHGSPNTTGTPSASSMAYVDYRASSTGNGGSHVA